MAEIIFQNKLDACRFFDYLQKYLIMDGDYENILLYEDQYIVKILESSCSEAFFIHVKAAFYEFITQSKRDDWFRGIVKNQFYFEDAEEQEQILEIIHSILEGQRQELSAFIKEQNEELMIREAIDHVFQENVSFAFDSFLKFRLRPYLQLLENYVEIAIDEYKMEQEYQMFVHMLRDFLAGREAKIPVLHVLLDEEIQFFDYQLEEIKRSELVKMIDRKLLVNHPVYVDSASIAPLLSIAPREIFLYTNDQEEPLVRTIKNIFEERVILKAQDELFKKKQLYDSPSENNA